MPNPNLDALIAIAEAAIAEDYEGTMTLEATVAFSIEITPDLVARLARRLKLNDEALRRALSRLKTYDVNHNSFTIARIEEALSYDGSPPVAGEEKR